MKSIFLLFLILLDCLLLIKCVQEAAGDTIEPTVPPQVEHENGMCTFFDSCGENYLLSTPGIRGNIPCFKSMPAIYPDGYFEEVKAVCPSIIAPNEDDTLVCCSQSQLKTLNEQLTASSLLFGRCPSCINNFVNMYCQITCSPNQSAFINVTGVIPSETKPGELAVTDETVYISHEFSYNFHKSCEEVVFPQTNGKAITLSCNGYTGDACTSKHFLDYLGSTNNGVAPLNMNFHEIGNISFPDVEENAPEPFEPFNTRYFTCNEAPDNESLACSCSDCSLSCPSPPILPVEDTRFTIGGSDGVAVVMLIIFCVTATTFLSTLVIYCVCFKERKLKYINFAESGAQGTINVTLVKPSDISAWDKLSKSSQDYITKILFKWGLFVASYPYLVIIVTVAIVVALVIGVQFILLTTDPIELWSAEGSKVRNEKNFYDEKFGKFYRTEQVIMKLKPELENQFHEYTSYTNLKYNFSNIFLKEYMLEMLKLHDEVRFMKVNYTDDDGEIAQGSLQDICFKPLEPDNTNCTITSVMGYWQNDVNQLNVNTTYEDKIYNYTIEVDYHDHFLYCVQAPATLTETILKQPCVGDYGGPIFPYLAVGGQGDEPYNKATAFIVNYVVLNFEKDDYRYRIVEAWEKEFLKKVENWETEHFDFAYFSERSVEDELVRSSQADITVFIISYLVIFLYIAIALGNYSSVRRIPVDSKITLGIAGIIVILSSVFASLGILGYARYQTSLIVIEVVPFLVLAIGADNVFILTSEYDREEKKQDETIEEKVARVFGNVGPSMLICSLTETTVFFLGGLTDMPAVEQFAYASAIAIFMDFFLQITLFLAILTLNAKRQEENRIDGLCCFKLKDDENTKQTFYLDSFFEKYYTPFLMNDLVRAVVMIGFFGVFCWCIYLTTTMTIGLDQDLSVPLDSYVLKYFDYMEAYLGVGVPVYFVTKGGFDFSNQEAGDLICASSGCSNYSLVQQISYASKNSEYWRIEKPAASWYDDYSDWLKPFNKLSCCKIRKNGDFCPSSGDFTFGCTKCLDEEGVYTHMEYYKYLPWFLIDNPSLTCNKGGHSAYGQAVHFHNESFDDSTNPSEIVDGTYFMTYHSVCIKSTDCTQNLIRARDLAENITKTIKDQNRKSEKKFLANEEEFEVYPYCLYYVYYEQYLTMVDVTLFQLGMCLIPTFLLIFILLGFNIKSGIITFVTILMIVVDTAGFSYLWGVDLNPVSLINLVTAIGLSVEFTSHVVRTFSLQVHPTRKERVIAAMKTMGPSVFAGVALTNLPGIIVLNWATAQLIQLFFFRMCLIITLLGTAHGLIFLPVLLSYIGPPVNNAFKYEAQQENLKRKLNDAEIKGKNLNCDSDCTKDEIFSTVM